VDFVNELKELGLEKEDIDQYKTLIEFIKWQNQTFDSLRMNDTIRQDVY
jgi:hypothetical protein